MRKQFYTFRFYCKRGTSQMAICNDTVEHALYSLYQINSRIFEDFDYMIKESLESGREGRILELLTRSELEKTGVDLNPFNIYQHA